MTDLKPFYKNVQSHYDLSDDFFALFLDPTWTYSCAYFERDDMTLEEAQLAKIDLALGKLGLEPGMRLLDVGCGWGTTIIRAREKYDVDVVGLTLSEHQFGRVQSRLDALDGDRKAEVRLQGWEEFDEPVDRIVSIGAFEHFRRARHVPFFEKAYRLLPDDGTMLLHTIVGYGLDDLAEMGVAVDKRDAVFMRFIIREIFPGGELERPKTIQERAQSVGFSVDRVHSLQQHYARTLETWTENLEARKDEALEIGGQEVYDRYMKYLSGCAKQFRRGTIDVMQFTLSK
ncbi:cyclopropane mycolic acid synthase family methyltransferase [Rhodococcus kroppenstedtii]|uniref:Class I SAM-dependent methyltransferase n=1 Tax=Rhodococcoides kroppenstedtii TaxID=293050 RepID=A0ABS7NPB4_9NOCA|nr:MULTISPECIES: cyclopropane mycolic acid synthase family methyltransferase [Rhodococcus]AMY19811.1 Cyclopropane mycolic acid synthase 1 [Rhodococcus sp. PBTS 1]MBT1193166.1 class I SAM-dependent methyltransferase [Rhodococcus kroppenstedtii]MBY6312075.1 class I SAM-dependent methyltransferase [Rhodococcus kroppenstedtii]MBY6319841.1 class I SAM-dependent methyltransferase [Rhodococcus kroppenstedtii]MBY6398524.1 class I SAM-dependent methyltransferase [Rhodococcus kroppenstedtii]